MVFAYREKHLAVSIPVDFTFFKFFFLLVSYISPLFHPCSYISLYTIVLMYTIFLIQHVMASFIIIFLISYSRIPATFHSIAIFFFAFSIFLQRFSCSQMCCFIYQNISISSFSSFFVLETVS